MLLDEIAKGDPLSQRDLSRRLNIALGLVNSYIRNLVSRGYVKIKAIPPRRYAYYLTPRGFGEKTRLTYHLLQEYTKLHRQARKEFRTLFKRLRSRGVRAVAFAGIDEVSEIAYLSLQELEMELSSVFDDEKAGEKFFRHVILPYRDARGREDEAFIVTTFLHREKAYRGLTGSGIEPDRIVAPDGTLEELAPILDGDEADG
jgi:DNA-binding MarR family transcriptional regulator